eukprot:459751_1
MKLKVMQEKQKLNLNHHMKEKQMCGGCVEGDAAKTNETAGKWIAKIGDEVEGYAGKTGGGCVEGDAAKTDESGGIWTAKIANEGELESPDEGDTSNFTLYNVILTKPIKF